MARSKWSKMYNELPYEIRHIGSMLSSEQAIQYLNLEKQRLIKRHKQSLKEINEHIKNHEKWTRDEGLK